MSLDELASLLLQAPGGARLSLAAAECELLVALLGDGEWQGLQPSKLAMFCSWGVGYLELDDEADLSMCSGESLRSRELRRLWARRVEGLRLADIEVSPVLNTRGFSVLRAEALAAFGLRLEAASSSAEPRLRRRVGQPVDNLPGGRELAIELVQLRAERIKGPIKQLAEKYKCSRDTIERRLKEARSSVALGVARFPQVANGKR